MSFDYVYEEQIEPTDHPLFSYRLPEVARSTVPLAKKRTIVTIKTGI